MNISYQQGLDSKKQIKELFRIDRIYFEDADDFDMGLAKALLKKTPKTIFIAKDGNRIVGYVHFC